MRRAVRLSEFTLDVIQSKSTVSSLSRLDPTSRVNSLVDRLSFMTLRELSELAAGETSCSSKGERSGNETSPHTGDQPIRTGIQLPHPILFFNR